nr:unnamed protein product [Digitaria exilis]
MEPPHQQQLSFDHGQLHVDATDGMSSSSIAAAAAGGVLAADDTTSGWPQAAAAVSSLSLYNLDDTTPSLMFGHIQQQQLMPAAWSMMSSKYLGPAQELLTEFCSLLEGDLHDKQRRPPPKAGRWDDVETTSASSSGGLWGHPSSLMSSMDLLELERRKTRLLSMVEEVDRRYRRYREQMRSVEASLEAVAGVGAAQVYTRLALGAMSRHFRCLRDALVAQLRRLRRNKQSIIMGDSTTTTTLGATKGDTPRLKVLDQCLRQQPGTIVDNYPWRPQRGLPERAVAVLRAWLFEHFLHPYPNDVDKHILARQTGVSRSQVSNWFINARVRLWKPMIEDMYTEEVKQQSDQASHDQNPTGLGAGGAVKAEQHNTAAMGGQISHFRTNLGNPSTTMTSMNNISSSIIGGGEHLAAILQA